MTTLVPTAVLQQLKNAADIYRLHRDSIGAEGIGMCHYHTVEMERALNDILVILSPEFPVNIIDCSGGDK